MKKYLSVILILISLVGVMSGCQTADSVESDKISVVTTIFPQYDFARQIAGDNIDIKMLLTPGMESHSYEPTPQDIKDIQSSDIFIYVGGEGDKWVEDILSSIDTSSIRIIALTDCVNLVEEEIIEGMQEDEDENTLGNDKEYDEHVWTSPKNAILIVKAINEALCDADPAKASFYEKSTDSYLSELDTLDQKFADIVESAGRDTIIFGDRFPFRYLADAYGIKYYAAFPGCATNAEPNAATLTFLIKKINNENIPFVFHIELSNEKVADILCESTGAEKLTLHSCHNLSKADFEADLTYLDLMNRNAETLKEALG